MHSLFKLTLIFFFSDTNRTTSTKKLEKNPTSQLNYVAKYGTKWSAQTTSDTNVGRRQPQIVLTEVRGPTFFAKRNITEAEELTAFLLFIDKYMVDHIVKCTEIEDRTKL